MLHHDVKNYLGSLDQERKSFNPDLGEHDIAEDINAIIKKVGDKDPSYKWSLEDTAESAAFGFEPGYLNDDIDWGTYYGPACVLQNQQGQIVESPSIRSVNEETLRYWTKRAEAVSNPILRSRYADLVIDFSPEVVGKDADIDLFHIVIDANIAICKQWLVAPHHCKKKIRRALKLAISTKVEDTITKVKDVIIDLDKQAKTEGRSTFWGVAFETLILEHWQQVTLSEQETAVLVEDMEEALKQAERNMFLAEYVVPLLAEHYAREKDGDNLMRVLDIFEQSIKTNPRAHSDALPKIYTYGKIHEMYRKYRDRGFQEAKDASDRIAREIEKVDLDRDKSLQQICVEIDVEKEDIEGFLKTIFSDTEQDKLETVIQKIATMFIPNKEELEKELAEDYSQHPLKYLATTYIISDNGLPVAELSEPDKDYDKHFQQYAKLYMEFSSSWLTLVIDELKKRTSKEDILKYFRNAQPFASDNQKLLDRAISAYWEEDYLISSHLFYPLIESTIRELIKNSGGTVLKSNPVRGYNYLALGTLLSHHSNILRECFSQVDENMDCYFRLVLTEKLGMNLRNDFAHGIGTEKFSTRVISDRVFHVMLCLSLARKKEDKQSASLGGAR